MAAKKKKAVPKKTSTRKVDALAKDKGSLASRLRKRRQRLENL